MTVTIDARRIVDWDTFHTVFAEAFGFPDFYGRNMDAWIDCMSSLDTHSDSMTTVAASPGSTVALQLDNVDEFIQQCPQQYSALMECAAFVNWRRTVKGEAALLALAFYKQP